MAQMWTRETWREFESRGWVQTVELVLGIVLIIIGIITGPIPGPGGIFFAAPGLALVLRTSLWAKKNYVRFKRWQPRAGRWTDWMLRRQSARRREVIRKERKASELLAGEKAGERPAGALIPDPLGQPPETRGDGPVEPLRR
jgi:hypothetical protein